MKRSLILTAGALLTFLVHSPATAQTEAPSPPPRGTDQAARELIQITGAAAMGQQVMEQMRPGLQQAIPDVPASFWDDFIAEVKPDEITEMIVPIYSSHFTLQELDELIAFYKTPLGRKVIAEMPAVARESMAAGQDWGRQLAERALRKAAARRSKPLTKS